MKRVDLLVALKTTKGKGEKISLPVGPILVLLAALGGLAYYALVLVKENEELVANNKIELGKKLQQLEGLTADIKLLKDVSPFYAKQSEQVEREIKKIMEENTVNEAKSQGLPVRLFSSKIEKVLFEMCRPNDDGTIPEKVMQQLVSYVRTGDQIVIRGLTKDYEFPALLAKRLAALKDDAYHQEPSWIVTPVDRITPIRFTNERIQKEIEQNKEGPKDRKKAVPGEKAEAQTPTEKKTPPSEKSPEAKTPAETKTPDVKPADLEKAPAEKATDKKETSWLETSSDHAIAEETTAGLSAVPGSAFLVGSVKRISTKITTGKTTAVVYEFEIVMVAREVK